MFRINYNKAYFSCKCFLLKREFLPDDLTFQIDFSCKKIFFAFKIVIYPSQKKKILENL